MIPFIDERLVDLLEEGESSMNPTPYVWFGYIVSPCSDARAPRAAATIPGRRQPDV
jgi:hypothetical protein